MTHELEVEVAGITFLLEVEEGEPEYVGATAEDCEEAGPREWRCVGAWVEEELGEEATNALVCEFSERIDAAVQEAELDES